MSATKFLCVKTSSSKVVATLLHHSFDQSLKTISKAFSFFSKRQRITLRLLYAVGRPSVVCCLSVTLVHPIQAVELFGNFFHHTIAQGLYFSGAKNRWWGTPLSP